MCRFCDYSLEGFNPPRREGVTTTVIMPTNTKVKLVYLYFCVYQLYTC